MIKVRRIGHATFETPDLEAQIEHYTKVTGLVVAARAQRQVNSCPRRSGARKSFSSA